MADFSRDPREHWLKPRFSKNEVANSGYTKIRRVGKDALPRVHRHVTSFHDAVAAEGEEKGRDERRDADEIAHAKNTEADLEATHAKTVGQRTQQ